jgi:hypothetical protein
LLFGASSASWAQSAASVQADGDTGIALGEDTGARLHLGADAGVGFDTNPYTTPLATGDFTGDVTARIRPYVEAALPGANIGVRGRAALDYGFLPGAVDPQTRAFLLYQGSASGDLDWNRGGALNFNVGDTVSMNTDPGVVALGTLLSRVNNQLRLGVGLVPGGGTLRLRFGLTSTLVHFFADDSESALLKEGLLDSLANSLSVRADYRFLPKTGFFADARAGWQLYPFAQREVPQALPVGVRIGVQGQVLAKLSGLASIGYENPLVFNASGLQTGGVVGLVGQAEAQWQPLPTTSLAGGYRRNFDPIALYQYMGQNKFYVQGSHLFGVTNVTAFAAWNLIEYGAEATGGQQLTDRPTGRFDHAIALTVRAAYFVLPWLSVGVSNATDWRLTNANDVSGTNPVPINLGYLRNETLLLASARY